MGEAKGAGALTRDALIIKGGPATAATVQDRDTAQSEGNDTMQNNHSRAVKTAKETEGLNKSIERITAVARLLRIIRPSMDKADQVVIEQVAQQADLHAEAIHVVASRIQGGSLTPSQELRSDYESMADGAIEEEDPVEVLDAYVACRLGSAVSTLVLLNARYLEDDDKPYQVIGDAIFEAGYWLRAARSDLDTALQKLNARTAPVRAVA